MDNFIVSARKYRPATFQTVVGQQHITGTLKNAIKNNQLAQAFLFCGPRGVGKTTCARILAKTINCENLTPEVEACGTCPSCVSFQHGNSFNIHELDAASNNSVDDIRSLIEQVRIPPQAGKYKIYIIDEVHMLSQAAFNAFLKTLEEPPSYAIFILATTEKHKIIPTILSRCQIFDFNRIKVEDISSHLEEIAQKEGVVYDNDGLHLIAQKSDGGLRDALSMFDQIVSFSERNISYKAVIDNLNILDYDYYFRITDAILEQDTAGVLLLFDEILSHGFDGNHFITGLASHFRNLLVSSDQSTLKLLEVSDGIKQKYHSQALVASASFLISALNISNQCDLNYRTSKNQRLQVELALIKLCHIPSVLNLGNVQSGSDSEQLKKKLNTTGRVANKAPEPVITAPTGTPAVVVSPEAQSASEIPELPKLDSNLDNKGKSRVDSDRGLEVLPPPPPKGENSKVPSESAGNIPPNTSQVVSNSEVASQSGGNTPSNTSPVVSTFSEPKPEIGESPEPKTGTGASSGLTQSKVQESGGDNQDKKPKVSLPKPSLNTGGSLIPNLNDLNANFSKKEEEEKEVLSGDSKEEFSYDVFLKYWNEYATRIKAEGKINVFTIMNSSAPVLLPDFKVEVLIENKIQENQLGSERVDLLNFLRVQLKNFSIELTTRLAENTEKRRLYTSTEKYQHMVEKNPALEEFRRRFNLDIF